MSDFDNKSLKNASLPSAYTPEYAVQPSVKVNGYLHSM